MPNEYSHILRGKTSHFLLGLYAEIVSRLISDGVLRTRNNPAGDFGEFLACKKLKLNIAKNSTKGYDAVDSQGKKYQIKARRITATNRSRMLGAIRDVENADFDFLIVVLLNEDFSLEAMYKMPKVVIRKYATYRKRINGYILSMQGKILADSKVKKI